MKGKGIWVIVSVLVVLGLILASCAQAPAPTAPTAPTTPAAPVAPKVIKWRGQLTSSPPPTVERFPWQWTGKANYYQAWWLKEISNGLIEVEIAPPGGIVAERDLGMALEQGTLDFGSFGGVMTTASIPEGWIDWGLPFAWEEPADSADGFYQYGLAAIIDEAYTEHNVVPLAHYGFGGIQGVGGWVGINTSPDFIKGKVVRAVGMYQQMFKALGAEAVIVSYGEMYMALKLGTIDGIYLTTPALETIKAKEVLKSWVVYPNSDFALTWAVNKDSFGALPEDLQRTIKLNALGMIYVYYQVANYHYNKWAAVNAEKGGLILTRYSEKDAKIVRDAGFSTWDAAAKLSPRNARMVEILRKQMRDMGKM